MPIPNTQPIQSPAQLPAPTDLGAVNLAKAIRTVESNGNFNAKGKSGEQGAYQFMPQTWQSWAGQYLGDPNAPMTPENQNKVAYSKILDLKNQGFTPEQVASIWNSGRPDPTGNVGVNAKGVGFNTPQYVKSVIDKFQQFKQGTQNGPTLPNPSQTIGMNQPDQTDQPKSLGGFIGNIFGSAGNLIGGLATSVLHPIQTLQNLGQAIQHPIQNIIKPEAQKYGLDKLLQGDVGGFAKQIEQTAYQDPAGVALDLSTVLGGVGLAGKLGAEGSTLANIGEMAAKASEATNPLSILGKGVGSVTKGVKDIGFGTAGLATGVGKSSLTAAEDIARSGTSDAKIAFNNAFSGQDTPQQILNDVVNEKQAIVDNLHSNYRNQLQQIKGIKSSLDISPITNELDNQLKNFNISPSADGTLDFSKSTIRFDGSAQATVQKIYDEMRNYGTTAGDRTPLAVDSLKKAFDDLYAPSSNVRSFVQAMKSTTRDVLNKGVDGYQTMTAEYAKGQQQLSEIRDSLGVGSKAKPETVMNKIMSVLNEKRANRLSTLNQFPSADLFKARIAGYNLSQFFPGGLAGKVAEGGGIAALLHPTPLVTGLAATSPKLMGLVAKGIGTTEGQATRIVDALSRTTGLSPDKLALILAQTNRISGQSGGGVQSQQ